MGKFRSISVKFNLITLSLLIVFSLLILTVTEMIVSDAVKENAVEKAEGDLKLSYLAFNAKYPGDWQVKDGMLYKGSTLVNDNNQMIDYISNLTNGTVTIFLHDTRVATNVINNGIRAVGTKASEQVINKTLENGENFYGEVDILPVL